MKNTILLLIALLLAQAIFAYEQADTVQFIWDNGTAQNSYDIPVGSIEAIRYVTEQPCSLFELSIYLQGAGVSEIHIWSDWSALPDTAGDLIDPINFSTSTTGWHTIDLEAEVGHKVYIPQRTDFQIGRIIRGGEPTLMAASNYTPQISHIWKSDDELWYYIGETDGKGYPFMIRAKGIYFDIDTIKQFRDIAGSTELVKQRTIAWGDYDNDGFDDILSSGMLFHNEHGQNFTNTGWDFNGRASWGDFNGDGRLDVASINYADIELWKNNGDGTFTNVVDSMGLVDHYEPKNAISFGDINGDGWLDMYVTTYEYPTYTYFPDHLYMNQGGTLYVEVSATHAPEILDDKYSRGAHFCDFDCDGDQDIYVNRYRLFANLLLVNDGSGYLFDEAGARGVAGFRSPGGSYGHTIGAVWCDFDNDGDFDIIATNLAHPIFLSFSDMSYIFRNDGYIFTDLFQTSGVCYYETHSCPAVGDYDNDGNLDLYISCTYDAMHSWIYKGNGDGTFTWDNYKSGVWTEDGWGTGWSDFDNDGDLDLVVQGDTSIKLYRNDRCPPENNWVELKLFCDITTNNYFAYGAQARLYLSDGRIMSRCIQGNTGTEACMDSRTMHFGMGGVVTADSLVILWPGGAKLSIADFDTDKRIYAIYESGRIDTLAAIAERRTALPVAPYIRVYPNPFNSAVTISFIGTRHVVSACVEIFDINGRLVYSPSPSVLSR